MNEAIFAIYSSTGCIGTVLYRCKEHAYDGILYINLSDPDVRQDLLEGLSETCAVTMVCPHTGEILFPKFHMRTFHFIARAVEQLKLDRFLDVERVELIQELPPEMFLSVDDAREVLRAIARAKAAACEGSMV